MNRRLRKTTLLKLGVFLLLGAIVNVAVAWTTANLIGNPWQAVYSGWAPQTQPSPPLFMNWVQGWPAKSLTCVESQGESWFRVEQTRIFAWRIARNPLWPGFAINTIFYTAILWLLIVGWRVPGKVRRFVRVRRGRCPACGYFIDPGACAASGGLCSECGARLPVGLRR